MNALLIGGTGTISMAITRLLAEKGWEVHLLNRGNRKAEVPQGVHWIQADISDEQAVRAILEARDICGMEKLMWGSDYPRTMTAITYRMSWDFIEKSPLLTPEEKQCFFHDNAHAFYRFGALPEMPLIHSMAE